MDWFIHPCISAFIYIIHRATESIVAFYFKLWCRWLCLYGFDARVSFSWWGSISLFRSREISSYELVGWYYHIVVISARRIESIAETPCQNSGRSYNIKPLSHGFTRLCEIWCRDVLPLNKLDPGKCGSTWWRYQMGTFSALLALCAGNSPVTGEFPSQRPVTRSFDVFSSAPE